MGRYLELKHFKAMRIKYIATYKKGTKQKRVTGFLRIPKDLPDNFTSAEVSRFVNQKHNIGDIETEITLKNYASKRFNYENATHKP